MVILVWNTVRLRVVWVRSTVPRFIKASAQSTEHHLYRNMAFHRRILILVIPVDRLELIGMTFVKLCCWSNFSNLVDTFSANKTLISYQRRKRKHHPRRRVRRRVTRRPTVRRRIPRTRSICRHRLFQDIQQRRIRP